MRPTDPSTTPTSAGQVLADVSEGWLVDRLRAVFAAAGHEGVLLGIGDDAAVVTQASGSVVATTDTMVKDQDWRDDWSSGHDVGVKIAVQNLADVAAMGAAPTGLLFTLAADPATPVGWVIDVARGIADTAAGAGAPVVGGDLSGAPAGFGSVSITALGDLQGRAPVTRRGARPGDVVAVGGSLGRSGAGLVLYLRGEVAEEGDPGAWTPQQRARDAVRRYHRAPSVNAPSGPRAAVAGATSMIDVSDGLSRDAGRIAAASGVVLDLDREALVRGFCTDEPVALALGPDEGLEQVLHGGEEHSLLATFPADAPLTFDADCRWVAVGRVRACADGERPGVTLGGAPLVTRAWDHFAG